METLTRITKWYRDRHPYGLGAILVIIGTIPRVGLVLMIVLTLWYSGWPLVRRTRADTRS